MVEYNPHSMRCPECVNARRRSHPLIVKHDAKIGWTKNIMLNNQSKTVFKTTDFNRITGWLYKVMICREAAHLCYA
nr:MAG TPA: hypothetical protein [Caudoviricetes sp.]